MLSDTTFSHKQIGQLDTLLQHHLKGLTEHTYLTNPGLGCIAVAAVILFIIVLGVKYYLKDPQLKPEHTRNFKSAAGWFALTTLFFAGLVLLGTIHFKKDTMVPDGDVLLLLSIIISIIGCLWAIFARIDAERAFLQARQTYQSFGESFTFRNIFTKSFLKTSIEHIGKPGVEMNFFLGFPVIGLFAYDQSAFKHEEPLMFFINFCRALERPDLLRIEGFRLTMSILPRDKAIEWMKLKDLKETDQLYEKVLYFYDTIIQRFKNAPNIIITDDFDENEKLRFILYEDKNENKCDSGIWVIPDFKKNIGFESAGFSSTDVKLIEVLHDII